MNLNTDHLKRCLLTLENSLKFYAEAPQDDISQEVYRNAVVKSFELSLEVSGKLLRRALKAFDYSHQTVDALFFKDVLRYAAKHGLLEAESLPRWFAYRDNRNSTAHDYGEAFANETLGLVQQFCKDASALERVLCERFSDV
jgi:nucleotidyltransferase substrate binding protein (TIGR01987 family)